MVLWSAILAVLAWIEGKLDPIVHAWRWHPPVGVYIGILGLVAVLVPLLRERLGRKEKAIWTGIMFVLLLLEIKSIYQDNYERQEQLNTTLANMQKIFSEITGGDSYIYFTIFTPPKMPMPTTSPVPSVNNDYISGQAFDHFVGKFPLHDVVVSIFCPLWSNIVQWGTVYPNDRGHFKQGISFGFKTPTLEKDAYCTFLIGTSNGSYSQVVQFLKNDDRWTWGSVLTKYGNSEFRHEYFDDGFPHDYKFPQDYKLP
jgi:hypothetical protein